ncbi:DNA repair protein RecO [bacterium]|nr:DNA repair protein RecO [bacterium]
MFIQYKTPAIFLGSDDIAEADRLFVVFTKKFGKLKILGRAIRKIKSKLRGGTLIFSLSYIEFIQGKTYKTLTEAIVLDSFLALRKNIYALKTAKKIAEVFDFFVRGQEPDLKIWKLLLESFNALREKSSSSSCFLVYYYFLWNFFSILGYEINFGECSSCAKRINQNFYFDYQTGDIFCASCARKSEKKKEIDSQLVGLVSFMLKKPIDLVLKLEIPLQRKKQLKEFTQAYLNYLKSLY